MHEAAHQQEVLARFGVSKQADLKSVIPAVAGGPVGGYLGYLVGSRYGNPQLGGMLGGVTGGVLGKVVSDAASQPAIPRVPPGAPFDIDPTVEDIPPWAVMGAQLMQPVMKQASDEHEGIKDVLLSDLLGPIHPVAEGVRNRNLGGALKGLAGQSLGVAGGGLLGYGAGKLLTRTLGHDPKLLNVPLSTILGGLGATIGGVRGLQLARGR